MLGKGKNLIAALLVISIVDEKSMYVNTIEKTFVDTEDLLCASTSILFFCVRNSNTKLNFTHTCT